MVDYRYLCEHSRVASRSSTAWLGTTMQMHWLCIFRVYFLLAHIAYYTGLQVVHFDLKVNMCCGMSLQWRIQDFPEEGAPTPRGGANIRFCQIFPKTALNWKNLDPRGGASKILLCRSATGLDLNYDYDKMHERVKLNFSDDRYSISLNYNTLLFVIFLSVLNEVCHTLKHIENVHDPLKETFPPRPPFSASVTDLPSRSIYLSSLITSRQYWQWDMMGRKEK